MYHCVFHPSVLSGVRIARTPGRAAARLVSIRTDPRVGVRAAQELGVQHPRQAQVGRVRGPARDLLQGVAPVDRAGRSPRASRPSGGGASPSTSSRRGVIGATRPLRAERARRRQRGAHGVRIGAAPAEVAGDGLADSSSLGVSVRSSSACADISMPGDADAALHGVVLDERGLKRAGSRRPLQPLHRGDRPRPGLHREDGAGEDRSPVHHHRAAPALGPVAPDLRAGEPEVLAQAPRPACGATAVQAHGPSRSRSGARVSWPRARARERSPGR